MTAVQQRVLNWLYSVLTSEYRDVQRTYHDTAATLSHYSSLSPQTDVYTYDNGTSALLVHLLGTLPIVFRGATYRFPVEVWLPHAYPVEPPICFVAPTAEMMVRPGQHVDLEGRIYHPYLAGWNPQSAHLLEFLGILRDVFAKEPPLVARPVRASAPHQPALPPKPSSHQTSTPLPPQLPPTRRDGDQPLAPAPPPKPAVYHTPRPGAGSQYASPPSRPESVTSYSHAERPSTQHTAQGMNHAHRGEAPTAHVIPGNSGPYPHPHMMPAHVQAMDMPPPTSHVAPAQQTRPLQHPAQFPHPNYSQTTSGQQPGPSQTQTQHAVAPPPPKPQPPPDLLSDSLTIPLPSETPPVAPPIPPNPGKDALLRTLASTLYQQRQHMLQQRLATLPALASQRRSLLTALNALNAEHTALTDLSTTLSANSQILHGALASADALITEARRPAAACGPAIDELLVAPSVVATQLYALVAEERAIADAIFVLGRAKERRRVATETWLRVTRALAREAFLKKVLIDKVATGMGLSLT